MSKTFKVDFIRPTIINRIPAKRAAAAATAAVDVYRKAQPGRGATEKILISFYHSSILSLTESFYKSCNSGKIKLVSYF